MIDNRARKQNIIPPYLLEYIAKNCDVNDKKYVLKTLEHVNKLMKQSTKEGALDSENNLLSYKNRKNPKSEDSY